MTVYVEYVVIDNMVIDILILNISAYFLKIKTKKIRFFLSGNVGTAISLISPLLPNLINLILKLPLSILLCIIAFNPKKFKELLLQLITFYLSTFLMIGACLAIAEMLNISYIKANQQYYEYNFPIGFVLLICAITYLLAKNITTSIFKRHKNDNLLFDVILNNGSNQIKATAFLDTGNTLQFDGKPISIINFDIFSKLYPKIPITDILLKKPLPLKNFSFFDVSGIGKTQQIIIFEINQLEIKNREIDDAILGLSLKNFSQNTNSEMIISNKLLEDMI